MNQNFYQEINQPDKQVNLAKASLYFAQEESPHLDIEEYLNVLDTIANEVKESLPNTLYPLKIIKTINQYLFDDLGFIGNSDNYYDPLNSYLNYVIDRRTGIPISLSVIYLEIAKRLNFPMVGIGMPGHFLIRPDFEDAGIFVDVFNQGEILFAEDCAQKISEIYMKSTKLAPHHLQAVSNRQILARMLTNLKYIYLNQEKYEKVRTIIEFILIIFPNHPLELRDRGLLYYHLGQWQQAADDLELYLAILPTAQDAKSIRELLQKIR